MITEIQIKKKKSGQLGVLYCTVEYNGECFIVSAEELEKFIIDRQKLENDELFDKR